MSFLKELFISNKCACCKLCDHAKKSPYFQDLHKDRLVGCSAFGQNRKISPDFAPRQYEVLVGTEKGEVTPEKYPLAETINEDGSCKKFIPARVSRLILRGMDVIAPPMK